MLGLFLLFCVLAVLGFILSWITGVVAREEIEIKTSMMILFVTGIVSTIVAFATAELNPWISIFCRLVATIVTLALLVRYAGRLALKQALIIAVSFAVILNLLSLGISWMLSK